MLLLPLPADKVQANEQAVAGELKSLEDPSILRHRVWVDAEWNTFKDSSDDLEFTMGTVGVTAYSSIEAFHECAPSAAGSRAEAGGPTFGRADQRRQLAV